jgi:hypothetical protein
MTLQVMALFISEDDIKPGITFTLHNVVPIQVSSVEQKTAPLNSA